MRLFTFFPAAAFILGSIAPAVAAQTTLPAGTRVEVRLVHSLSSGTASVGESFALQAAAPVLIGHRVVIAKGAGGTGRIVSVSKAHGKSAGKIGLAFTSIHAVGGTTVMLTQGTHARGNSEKGKASTASIAATIALGPIGLFAHNMVKGKDVTVTPSETFAAWVESNTRVTVH